ncbi:MAG: RNA-binding transcriptional accessory protein [Bacteroidetes bacterium]|nr:RNA-binding transcriptional accessory protein [Bacteroidota bacterium]
MIQSAYIHKIAEKLNFSLKQINNIHELHSEGATIPFMARYRKEATGNLDEVQIGAAIEQIQYFTELDKRKETVLKTIEGLGKLTPTLKSQIENCFDATQLEDIYLPYKPKRKTRASAALEKGLEPLATLLFNQGPGKPEDEAAPFVNEQVKNIGEALQGASDIIAEWISENQQARNAIRELFKDGGILHSKVFPGKKDEEGAQKYKDYFDFSEPLSQSPSHRVLAIRRGEKEGFISMDIAIDKLKGIDALEKIFIKATNENASQVKLAVADSLDRLLKPSIETEFRLFSKTQADEEAIKVFAENLRQLLLASPLGSKKVLAIDPGFRTGCKIVCLDEQGNFLVNSTIYPHPPQNESSESIAELKKLVKQYGIESIGIGNGTAGRETEQLVRGIDFGKPVSVFMVAESGASIYSASEVAREEFPELDVTVRGAISIGRRLLDPLSELVKIDAKSIGVGQYQHDVNQTKLKEELDKTVESCVNHVGVDINTSSRHLLMYVSGLSSSLAKNIVDYRAAQGGFKSREALKKVPLMGPKTFEQCAGFLRIREAENPLDNSAVHPETYAVVETMAADLGHTVTDLIKDNTLRSRIDKKKYISASVGELTINDILKELEKPGRDPRSQVKEFRFEETIRSIEDVKPGMTVPGIVTNITNFGVFVDIGVKQDGLIHISALSNTYVSNPNDIVKLQQQVLVTVIEVDVARKRISLSMKDHKTETKTKPSIKPFENKKPPRKQEEPLDSFQSKLMELKKKFKQ